jgi:hypothetical protein
LPEQFLAENKQVKIELGSDQIKEYLKNWKEQIATITVFEFFHILENNTKFEKVYGHPFSFLVETMIFIIETMCFPIMPIINQNYPLTRKRQTSHKLTFNLWSRSIRVDIVHNWDSTKPMDSSVDSMFNKYCPGEYTLFGRNIVSHFGLKGTDHFLKSDLELYFTDLRAKLTRNAPTDSMNYLGLVFYTIELPESLNGISKDVLNPLRNINHVLSGTVKVIMP